MNYIIWSVFISIVDNIQFLWPIDSNYLDHKICQVSALKLCFFFQRIGKVKCSGSRARFPNTSIFSAHNGQNKK